MENEYMKRGFLLPEGCKNLADAPKYKVKPSLPTSGVLPPIVGELIVPPQMTVRELATVLAEKPFRIIADLMSLGIFANVNQQIDFDLISGVMRKYGFIAKRAA